MNTQVDGLGEQGLRSFKWLNATQFFGALNDNLFKLLIVFFLIGMQGKENAFVIQSVAMGVFVLPFILFATTSGMLADRFRKSSVIKATKVLEIPIMLLGCIGFAMGWGWFLYIVLFLMSLQSTLFGPAKYGVIHELVGKQRLSRANGYIEAFTYLAIIFGSALAPLLVKAFGGQFVYVGLVCVGISVVGLAVSLRITRTPIVDAGAGWSPRFVSDAIKVLRSVRSDRELLLAVWASAYFLGIGATLQTCIIPIGMENLGWDETTSGFLLFPLALGIGIGAVLAGWLSGENIEFGVVPIASAGICLSCLFLAVLPATPTGVVLLLLLLGMCTGMFIIPVKAFLQFRAPREHLGRILAASSFLSWIAVLISAVVLFGLSKALKVTARELLTGVAILTALLTLASLKAVPDFFVRFLAFLLRKLCYRVRVEGLKNIPVEGGALLVANHTSYVDALIIGSLRPRRVRFLMSREVYSSWRFFRWVLDILNVIPISGGDNPRQLLEALHEARKALDEGYLVCIFPEGSISRNGFPREFRPGLERIVRNSDYPIIPIALGGLWGSIFSYFDGKIKLRKPRQFPYPVQVVIGESMPSTTSVFQIRQRVMELSTLIGEMHKEHRKSAFCEFVHVARRNWGSQAMNDTSGRTVTYGQALIASMLLARKLRVLLGDDQRVGVILPSSVAGALVNIALAAMHKISVNLNFTASKEALASAVRQGDIRKIITARAFLEKMPGLQLEGEVIHVEDLFAGLGKGAKIAAAIRAKFFPQCLLSCGGFSPDDVLTVIFSSGSTGIPKGVELTHHNILSNIDALKKVFKVSPTDNICATLPFFHSFGFTGTIWFPLLSGCSVSFHPNPMDGAIIAKMVRENHCTIMMTTPTFLMTYLRKATREDFQTFRILITGAEKLKTRVADAFEERFGIRPLEGYGATELAPVGALNVPNVDVGGLKQIGAREGTVGHPLPGVAMKIVDPDNGLPLGPGEPGLLLVKGPNVMKGYLGDPARTAEVLKDGWYSTGDIAFMDEDGFVTISDRLSRFSKIAGEMVPHLAVEEAYHKGLGVSEQVLAVTSVPDEKKGEKLVVIYTPNSGGAEKLQAVIKAADLPNLWKPAHANYVAVEALPVLGTGKLDLKALKEIAAKVVGKTDHEPPSPGYGEPR